MVVECVFVSVGKDYVMLVVVVKVKGFKVVLLGLMLLVGFVNMVWC